MGNKRMRLGDLLVNQGIITAEQLNTALKERKGRNVRLGNVLVSSGFTTESEIINALHLQLGIERADLRGIRIPQDIINMFPAEVLRKNIVFPLGYDPQSPNTLLIATADPLDMNAQDDIAVVTGCRILLKLSSESEIQSAIDRHYGSDEANSAAERYAREREIQLAESGTDIIKDDDVSDAPMVKLIMSIVEQAVRQRASDIHFDAGERNVRIRYRIDGSLIDKLTYDIALLPAMITRVKILSDMDISEKRKPQDGRMTMTVDRHDYDIRVSTLPTFYGEKMVLRLALTVGLTRALSELGLKESELASLKKILARPNGIVLVTGPTGSGKSTTLYAALSTLNKEDVNIITVEDPVEASIGGINQVQVNNKTSMSFANALRSILRQDPDIIMVGEIRDQETASIAVQAAITGHLVFSTLHTNSAAASVTRLLDMGIEPYLLSDALTGIVAQRLVRRLCLKCRKSHVATVEEKDYLGLDTKDEITLYEPDGCPV
ncbi:MAG: GspE/PulE family protein, partial [Oscillospiraceae bacterium]|nr:GspE/PulE family protein [Oscillospiraceae bacterium]